MLPFFPKSDQTINNGASTAGQSHGENNRSLGNQQNPASHRQVIPRVTGRDSISTPSILDALKDETVKHEIQKGLIQNGIKGVEIKNAKPFSPEELVEVWKVFVETIDLPQIKSALTMREPILGELWQVTYDLDSEIQLNRLTLDIKPKLLGFLRTRLKNEEIEIQFKVTEHINQETSLPYTDSEKWQTLVEKFPDLAKFRTKFGLDFEH